MTKISVLFLILISSSSNCFVSQSVYGVGELTSKAKELIDKYFSDTNKLSNKNSAILFEFRNKEKVNVDTLIISDIERNAVFLHEERYAVYKDFKIIVRGFPDKKFFNMNIDSSILKKHLKKEELLKKQVEDSIKNDLYLGYITFIPKKERHLVKRGIYKGHIVVNSEYESSMYYYIVYSYYGIVNKIRSDLELPNDYRWVPIR
jgi:hypothetical protein